MGKKVIKFSKKYYKGTHISHPELAQFIADSIMSGHVEILEQGAYSDKSAYAVVKIFIHEHE